MKKFYLILALLTGMISTALATDVTVSLDKTKMTSGSSGSTTWNAYADPAITLTGGAMRYYSSVYGMAGSMTGKTYTITIADGYKIKGYEISFKSGSSSYSVTVTPTGNPTTSQKGVGKYDNVSATATYSTGVQSATFSITYEKSTYMYARINYFKVTYEKDGYTFTVSAGNGGSAVFTDTELTEKKYSDGDTYSVIATANKGYEFSKWTKADTGDQISTNNPFETTISAENKDYYASVVANFKATDYTITYNLNGGINASSNPATYNIESETFSLADPTKDGCTFAGWTWDGQEEPTKSVTIEKGSTGAKSFTAVWAVDATMNITSAGWATFCAPFEVTLSNNALAKNVKAYTGEIANNSWVKLTEVENNTIAAGTPVVLSGEEYTETYTAVPTYTESTTPSNGCLTGNLTGAVKEVPYSLTSTTPSYLLQNGSEGLGWYKVAQTGLNIGKNRCYMTMTSGNNAREFFGMSLGETTAIQSIATEAKTKSDGKYLVNGRLLIVKSGKAYNANGQLVK